MLNFAVKRVLRGFLTLWLVVTAVFIGLRLSGDPVTIMLGHEASPEAVSSMQSKMGLDDSIGVQYYRYLEMLVGGDFGTSLREPRPAATIVLERVPATLQLAAVSLVLAVVIGIPVGIFAATHRNSLLDRGLMALAVLGQAAPAFFIGILLIMCFSLWLQILPSGGRGSWQHLIMPSITLSSYSMASLARITRAAMLDVAGADFVRTARAKGLGESRIVMGHMLRNAALPVVTVLGIHIGVAISGAVITETVFAWPGMGRLAATAVFRRDYPVIQFAVLLIATTVILVNTATDILYGIIDPRIRVRGGAAT